MRQRIMNPSVEPVYWKVESLKGLTDRRRSNASTWLFDVVCPVTLLCKLHTFNLLSHEAGGDEAMPEGFTTECRLSRDTLSAFIRRTSRYTVSHGYRGQQSCRPADIYLYFFKAQHAIEKHMEEEMHYNLSTPLECYLPCMCFFKTFHKICPGECW